uniref:Uncharacterized protein n=1 Tax=Romanomermis culicivorax TaxID=13658 RepID=A0A915JC58_ROMCU
MANNNSQISQRSFESKCDLGLGNFGPIKMKSTIDMCSRPPLLNIIIRMHKYIWKMTFSPQGRNGGESRLFGPAYYPMRVLVNFHPGSGGGHYSNDKNDTASEHGRQNLRVKREGAVGCTMEICIRENNNNDKKLRLLAMHCCLEAMKTSWSTCYLDTTIATTGKQDKVCRMETAGSAQLFRNPQFPVFCVILVALLLLSIFAISLAYRRYKKVKKRREYVRKMKQNLLIVPKLPGAKLFQERAASFDHVTNNIVDQSQKSCDQERTLSTSNSTITDEMIHCRNRLNFLKNLKMRESKLVQTSCTSLETEILILSRSTAERATNDRSSDYTSPTSSDSQKSSENDKTFSNDGGERGHFISV